MVIPEIDVGFYRKEPATTIKAVYESSDIISGGSSFIRYRFEKPLILSVWSYNYFAPENLRWHTCTKWRSWKAFAVRPKPDFR
ncbi:hypothetical protein F5Y07DRAFT_59933 [Xylaria sp. FL0933]|nr:hypothetical protein F5Y07DRAFT_59933 [Xylaria sp. FL0933]